MLSLLTLLIVPHLSTAVCPDTLNCIERIRRVAADSRRFWFGEQWKDLCTGRNRHPVDCFNPHTLHHYHSLGSRLFRVKTYQTGFLRNLSIFPRVTFRVRPGSYRGCDHDFVMDSVSNSVIEADPDMIPVEPFLTRFMPDIRWPDIQQSNHSYTLLIVDVGFATLNYLSQGYPQNTKTTKYFTPSENFRHFTNPMVVLVFEEKADVGIQQLMLQADGELFDLPRFMLDNGLENSLIGMNLILVSTDAYSIEKQRVRAVIDNCHSLVETKLRRENRWEFVASFPLSELNAWLSVDYYQPAISTVICCEHIQLRETWIPLDPLGDGKLPSLTVLNEPRISSLRIPQDSNNYRSTRDFVGVVLIDHLYTLVLFNPTTSFLHWMIVDIPSSSLAAANLVDGDTVSPYIPPIPSSPRECSTVVFMLFTQPRTSSPHSSISQFHNKDHMLRSHRCIQNCTYRSLFDISQFKSFHQLRVSAINWMTVCYDEHEAGRQLAALALNKSIEVEASTTPSPSPRLPNFPSKSLRTAQNDKYSVEKKRRTVLSPETKICSSMGLSIEETCRTSAAPKMRLSRASIICLLLLLSR